MAGKSGKQKVEVGSQKTPVKKVRRNLFTDDGSEIESSGTTVDKGSQLKPRKDHKQKLHRRHSVAGEHY